MKSQLITHTILGLVALSATMVMTDTGSVEATDEFPANPSVDVELTCSSGLVGDLRVLYANYGGLADAEFTTVIDGVAQEHVSLDAAIAPTLHYSLPEGAAGSVTISAPEMATFSAVLGPVDCFDASMHTEVSCVAETPTISVTVTNVGQLDDLYLLAFINLPWFNDQQTVHPGASFTWTQALADGAPEEAYLYSNNTGLIDIQGGSVMCTAPTTAVAEETPVTTTLASSFPELPETGATTMTLVFASLLLGAGWFVRRLAGR